MEVAQDHAANVAGGKEELKALQRSKKCWWIPVHQFWSSGTDLLIFTRIEGASVRTGIKIDKRPTQITSKQGWLGVGTCLCTQSYLLEHRVTSKCCFSFTHEDVQCNCSIICHFQNFLSVGLLGSSDWSSSTGSCGEDPCRIINVNCKTHWFKVLEN